VEGYKHLSMTSSQMLIVRVAEEDLEKLDRLAVLQGTAGSTIRFTQWRS